MTGPAWVPCPCCGEVWCWRHGRHTFECDCPAIEDWETDPYGGDTMATDINLELALARNMFGRLRPETRARVQAVVDDPSQETWDDAHGIIVGSDGWMTLWQAVLEVDPTFPRLGPSTTQYPDGRKSKRSKWSKVPDRRTLLAALRYATH